MSFLASGKKLYTSLIGALLGLGVAHSAMSLELAQTPLFLSQPVRPVVMLNMSNDHQLYFKAYDDYSDLTKDGVPDTTYVHGHKYYGYFDSDKCYKYQNNRFEPSRKVNDRYCNGGGNSGEWSGNFLNWATMTRVDVVRKILYGGYRSTDSDSATVLERALLPNDAHSFAKYYDGTDIPILTPFSRPDGFGNKKNDGLTICNTTEGSGFSQSVDTSSHPPLMRVARGNYSLWASNERWQCRWGLGSNANDTAKTEINAHSSSPVFDSDKLGAGDYNVRVKACASGLLEENCRSYPSGSVKPAGLLQKYGENGEIYFGLMTGSYKKNTSGGVLRKNVGDLTDEINVETNGTFISNVNGILSTLNRLRIHGYDYSDGLYDHVNESCPFGLTGIEDGICSNWGNPQSEIYLESLRYLAGKSPAYSADDSQYIPGLSEASWTAPLSTENYCAPVNVLQFNASTSSYDGDALNGGDIGANIDTWTNNVGTAEQIHGKPYFVGESGGDSDDELCTPKTVTALSDVQGTCPDAPRLKGTYDIAGLAYYARSNDINSTLTGVQKVRTYGIALASATPSVTVKVPGGSGKVVNILPACQNKKTDNDGVREGNCAIVDFKIVPQTSEAGVNSGKLYINWEAAEQGGDYDSDMWGVLDYDVSSLGVTISTTVVEGSSSRPLEFGYVLSGTQDDGYHAHSGINNAIDGISCVVFPNNAYCGQNDLNRHYYPIGSSSASQLESPLYYAAKWGGYGEKENGQEPSESEIQAGDPETYFYAIDPAELETKLAAALDKVASDLGSASAVATNSTRLGTDTYIYQALFDSADWSGEIKAIQLHKDGSLATTAFWSTRNNNIFPSHDLRTIYTYSDGDGDGIKDFASFQWDNLSVADQALLSDDDGEAIGQDRLNWVRGQNVAGMRERSTLLGDIVNSNPAYAGRRDYHFDRLPDGLGGDEISIEEGGVTTTVGRYTHYYNTHKKNRQEVLYVGANDGMLHAFNANTGAELFAYIPSVAIEKLKNMTLPNYGAPSSNPHKYSVDGKIFVGDAYFTHNSVTKWRNVLVGTYGAGAKGLFALDVTDPGSPDLLFELNGDDHDDIGNIMGQPQIAPVDGKWQIVIGNGYNSANGQAKLIMVDLNNPSPANILAVATNGSGSNGLAGPSLMVNSDAEVTAAYAGDLLGNMWKFDKANNGDWQVAYRAGGMNNGDPVPLFKAEDGNGNAQPITAAPTLGLNTKLNGATMVYFGTGSYIAGSDNQAGDVIQSVYTIADTGSPIEDSNLEDDVSARDAYLLEKVITETNGTRAVSNNATEWWSTEGGATAKRGWYMDLLPQGVATPTGERVISKPLLLYDRLLFPTLITSSNACAFGGSGWEMELVAVGDQYSGHSIYGEGGTASDYAIIGYSEVIRAGEKVYRPASDIKGNLEAPPGDKPKGVDGRMSWRQLK
ncbi:MULTISPECIES: PilC/PilY family type IV pilus protein [unclassified Microbulbifer]|uniref:pilus assembly protein n=1 Tax=unclassified Microbulbifer TaxID=2619833 RepID=UPI0027E4F8DD|nr:MULTISPECIES: PilC/PilY family type IV pilus protein [unclassified Microbulbifer]